MVQLPPDASNSLPIQLAQLHDQIALLERQKAELELLIEMLTEHSDGMVEDLQGEIETAERRNAEQFKLITGSVPVAILVSRMQDDKIVYANQFAGELTGTGAADLLNHTIADFYWENKERAAILEKVSAQGTLDQYELCGRNKEKKPFWAVLYIRPLIFNNEPGLLEVYYDLTQRKQAEQTRERFARQLHTAAEISNQANTILDPHRLLRIILPLVKERFSLSYVRAYLLNSSGLSLELDFRAETDAAPEIPLKLPMNLEPGENMIVCAARSKKVIQASNEEPFRYCNPPILLTGICTEIAVPLLLGETVLGVLDIHSGAEEGFNAIDIDVFRILCGQITTALQNARLFEEIQETAEQLRELDRIKGEFLATVSHELQTPLNAILGYSEILMTGIEGELSEEIQEDIRGIQTGGERLQEMISAILDLTSLEAGRLTLSLEELDLAPLLHNLRDRYAEIFFQQKSRIEFKAYLPDKGLWAEVDSRRFQQIVDNLLSNALKFTDKGQVTLQATLIKQWICIAVEDTGVGIDVENQEIIFEQFRQVDGSQKRQAQGLGLGLAITRRLVILLGGRLELKSIQGKGSCFKIYLPYRLPPAKD